MSPLGHIVERCEGSYTQPELHRGVKGKDQLPETSCFYRPQFIFYEQGQRRITPKRSLPWCRRRDSNLRIPPIWCGALPTELRLHTPGIRRGQEERKDGWNEDTDITPHPHSRTSVRQHSSKWRNLKYLFSVQLRVSLTLIPAKLVKADVVICSNQFQLRQPRFPCASLVPSQCVPAQPHQFRCHIPADNRVSAFSEPLKPFRECTHITTSHSPNHLSKFHDSSISSSFTKSQNFRASSPVSVLILPSR